MKTGKIKAIYKKEILDLLRDKKTLIMMVLVPLIIYPLIMVVSLLVTSAIADGMQNNMYKVCIVDDNADYDRKEFISLIEDAEDELSYNIQVTECDNPVEALLNEEIDACVTVSSGDKLSFDIEYLSSVTNSNTAADMLGDKLKIYKNNIERKTLKDLGVDADYVMNPINVDYEDHSSNEERLGSVMGAILPFLLITSILMGAVYPAIDTTAGEKERGTLETLLTLPVKNNELIMGKFLAVATISVVSAMLNLISMGMISAYLFGMMNMQGTDAVNVNLFEFVPAVFIVVLCVIAFSLFISAITMCISIFAKSYKEANNYVTPLLLVVMFTGYIGFIPNIEFNSLLASVPVVNICLLISNILVFKYNFSLIIIVLVTNIAYAAITVWVLGKIYRSEDVLFGESGVNLQLFTRRSELKAGGVANLSDVFVVAAVVMLLILYVGSLIQLKFLLLGLFITQLFIIGVPVFAAWYTKKDFRDTFSLRKPKFSGIIGAIILETGTFLMVMLLSALLTKIWPQDAESVNESFNYLLDGITFVPSLFVIAVMPAICEEGLFRGYMLSAAKKKMKPWLAILLVSVLFGIYHLSFVKFFTTGLLGIAFAYAVYKSGSIVLSSIMHFINNAVSVVIMFYGDELHNVLPVLFKDDLSCLEAVWMLVISVIFAVCGVLLINVSAKEQKKEL